MSLLSIDISYISRAVKKFSNHNWTIFVTSQPASRTNQKHGSTMLQTVHQAKPKAAL